MRRSNVKMIFKELESSMNFEKAAKNLYISAFPREERAPFFLMKRKALRGFADFLNIFDGEEYIGFAYVITGKTAAYVFYLAIEESKRGMGYGSKTLQALMDRYEGMKLFLALEEIDENAANNEERIKRHDFYEKNGLKLVPCHIVEGGVRFCVRCHGEAVTKAEYDDLANGYLDPFFRLIYSMKMED